LAVSWTLSLCLSCMSSPMVSPPTPSSSHILPHHSLPQNFLQRPKPASIERHKLRLEDIRHRLSAAALQKVEIETNRLRKSRRSRRPGKLPTTSCMMTTRSLVERRGICEPGRRLCGVDGTYFHDYNCLEGTNSTSCSAMVEEQKEVVGTCLILMATTPACRYTPPHGKSIVMLEHKSCPSPAQISQPSSILRRVNSNVGNTGAKKTDIW